MQEFDAGVGGRELPAHGLAQGVAFPHPSCDLGPQPDFAFDAPVQALHSQGGELDFGDAGRLPCLGV